MHPARTRRWSRTAAALLLLGSTGCFGTFPVTKALYNWNRTVSPEKEIRSLFFAALVLVPVYEIAMLSDAIVFNTLEFWGVQSPLGTAAVSTTKIVTAGDVTVKQTMTEDAAGRTMVLEESKGGVFQSRTTLHQDRDALLVTSVVERADGKVISRAIVQEPSGELRVVDPATLIAH